MLPLCLPECQTPVTVPCGPEMMSFVRWHHVEMSNETTQKSRWTRTRPSRMKLRTQHTSTAQHETIKTRRRNNEDIGCWLNTVGHHSCILQYFYCVCHHVCAYDFTCVPDTSNIVSEWHGCPNNGHCVWQYADTHYALIVCLPGLLDRPQAMTHIWSASGCIQQRALTTVMEDFSGRRKVSWPIIRFQLLGLQESVVWFTYICCLVYMYTLLGFVQKTGKDLAEPNGYRPISWFSCVGHLMEHIINLGARW